MNGRRLTAGLAGLALLIGLAIAPPVQQTEAYFTDSEYATATFTGTTMTPLSSATCTLLPGLTFTGVKLTWKSAYDIAGITEAGYSPVSGTNSSNQTVTLNRSNIV